MFRLVRLNIKTNNRIKKLIQILTPKGTKKKKKQYNNEQMYILTMYVRDYLF